MFVDVNFDIKSERKVWENTKADLILPLQRNVRQSRWRFEKNYFLQKRFVIVWGYQMLGYWLRFCDSWFINSVTRLGDNLDFGQLLKAFGNN